MIDEASLEKALTKMEREVLALKTAARRGLGATKFYSKEVSWGSGKAHSFRVYIADGEPMPAFIQAYVNVPTPFYDLAVRLTLQSYGASVSVTCLTSGTITLKVISSSFIERIE